MIKKTWFINLILLFSLYSNNNIIMSMEKNIFSDMLSDKELTQEAYILNMPDEMLLGFVELVIDSYFSNIDIFNFDKAEFKNCVDNLCLICKRFDDLKLDIIRISKKIINNRRNWTIRLFQLVCDNSNLDTLSEDEIKEIIINSNISSKNSDNVTALDLAIKYKCKNIMELLIRYSSNIKNIYNLHYLLDVMSSSIIINSFLSHLALTGQINSLIFKTLLLSDDNMVIMRMLINAGADINQQDDTGMTVLMKATNKDLINIFILFMLYGANLDIQDHNGYTALMHAVQKNNKNVVKLLIDCCGANLNIQDNNGYTALMHAIEYAANGQEDIVKLLIDNQANINIINNDGYTAFNFAVDYQLSDDIIELLKMQDTKKSYCILS